jgi:3-oxoacyl-[acyl-carrier protein] reductase
MAKAASWSGKVAIVTGAASGIGEATAELFAEQGAAVVLADLGTDAVNAVAERIAARGARVLAMATDVSSEAAVRKLVDRTAGEFGRIDVLANVAGIMLRHASLAEWPLEDFRRVVEVDLTSLFITTQAAAPLMAKGGGGAVVNISSVGGIVAVAYSPPYAAAKAGVLGLTRSLAPLLEPFGIRCNAILPTLVDTPLIKDSPVRGKLPTLTAREVALAVSFVAADVKLNASLLCVDKTPQGARLKLLRDPPEMSDLAEQPY